MLFITDIEEWATEYTIEENIAIVHFGSEAKIMQQLTNDYNKVREAVGQYIRLIKILFMVIS